MVQLQGVEGGREREVAGGEEGELASRCALNPNRYRANQPNQPDSRPYLAVPRIPARM